MLYSLCSRLPAMPRLIHCPAWNRRSSRVNRRTNALGLRLRTWMRGERAPAAGPAPPAAGDLYHACPCAARWARIISRCRRNPSYLGPGMIGGADEWSGLAVEKAHFHCGVLEPANSSGVQYFWTGMLLRVGWRYCPTLTMSTSARADRQGSRAPRRGFHRDRA